MKPNDGKPVYTVETEFEATGWGSAYEHCMGLGTKFNSVVQSHRLKAVGESDSKAVMHAPTNVPALPAPQTEAEEPKPPAWLTLVTVPSITPQPWPYAAQP